jgi:aryl-phospho-beta-D-glucosidase BglC (GH1 family)
VQWAEQAGLDVILDLHWSDQGDFTVMPAQQLMADAHSLEFWGEVAARYKGDGRVFFELYNEPHDVSTSVWLSGGSAGSYMAVGMQQLHDAVRAAGADNPVICGGLDWGYDLSFVATSPVQGYNVLYATHPYNNSSERQPSQWEQRWGFLTATAPVVITEFGDGTGSCSSDWDKELIAYADQRRASWTAWAWYKADCKFPALLTDWSGTTTNEGAVVKGALLGYHDPPAEPPAEAGPPPDAGSDASDDANDSGLMDAGSSG